MKIPILKYPNAKGRVKVKLTPLGNKIKYQIAGKVFCTSMKCLLPNTVTCSIRNNVLWTTIFGNRIELKKFIKKNRVIHKVIPFALLGYDKCDVIKN